MKRIKVILTLCQLRVYINNRYLKLSHFQYAIPAMIKQMRFRMWSLAIFRYARDDMRFAGFTAQSTLYRNDSELKDDAKKYTFSSLVCDDFFNHL